MVPFVGRLKVIEHAIRTSLLFIYFYPSSEPKVQDPTSDFGFDLKPKLLLYNVIFCPLALQLNFRNFLEHNCFGPPRPYHAHLTNYT